MYTNALSSSSNVHTHFVPSASNLITLILCNEVRKKQGKCGTKMFLNTAPYNEDLTKMSPSKQFRITTVSEVRATAD